MADNKRRGRFGRGSDESASQSIFDLFEPPPDEPENGSFGPVPIVRDDEDLDLTDSEVVESAAAAEAEAAGLRHWTEPPTGQVPAAFAATTSSTADEVRGPSWRGEEPSWDGPDLSDVFGDTEAVTHRRRAIHFDEQPAPAPEAAQSRRRPPRRLDAAPSVFDEAPKTRPADRPVIDDRPEPRRQPARRRPLAESPVGERPVPAAEPRHPRPEPPSRPDPIRPEPPSRPDPIRAEVPRPDAGRLDPTRPLPAPESRPAPSRPAPPPPGPPVADDDPSVVRARRQQPADRSPEAPPAPRPSALDEATQTSPVPARRRGAHDLPSRPAGGSPSPASPDRGVPLPERPGRAAPPAPVRTEESARLLADLEESPRLLPDPGDPGDAELAAEYYGDDIDRDGRSLIQSTAVGLVLVGVVVATLLVGGPGPTVILTAVLAMLAVMELFNAMRVAGLRPATLLGLVGSVALPISAYLRGDAGYPLVVGLAVVFGMLWYLTGADTERPVLNLGLTFTGVLWIGGLAGFAALMVRGEGGTGLLLATILITATSDTLSYLGGMAYGTRSFHSASPSKTWEGTITGFFGALFMGLVLGVIDVIDVFSGEFMALIVMSGVIGLLAPIGDLAESLVKRDLGLKDMGSILPGHGGILDRVDALLFALPGAYYVAVVYQLI